MLFKECEKVTSCHLSVWVPKGSVLFVERPWLFDLLEIDNCHILVMERCSIVNLCKNVTKCHMSLVGHHFICSKINGRHFFSALIALS